MSQYCRYCAFCSNGDTYYCGEHDEILSASYVKRPNNCKDYIYSVLGDVDSGKPYKPRPRKKKAVDQMSWWRKMNMCRKGIPCEYATINGFCQLTACLKHLRERKVNETD